ncbi:hypothetical protein HAX54_040961, partial [Datura stramonium]|nr:hypothetical protein [Datura stramonium]
HDAHRSSLPPRHGGIADVHWLMVLAQLFVARHQCDTELDVELVWHSMALSDNMVGVARGHCTQLLESFSYRSHDEFNYGSAIVPPRVNATSFKIDSSIYTMLKVEGQFLNSIDNNAHQYLTNISEIANHNQEWHGGNESGGLIWRYKSFLALKNNRVPLLQTIEFSSNRQEFVSPGTTTGIIKQWVIQSTCLFWSIFDIFHNFVTMGHNLELVASKDEPFCWSSNSSGDIPYWFRLQVSDLILGTFRDIALSPLGNTCSSM